MPIERCNHLRSPLRAFALYSFRAISSERDLRVADKYSVRTFSGSWETDSATKQPAGLPHPQDDRTRDCRASTPDFSDSAVRFSSQKWLPKLLPNVKDEPRRELARRVPHYESISAGSYRSSFGRTRRDRSRRWLWRLVRRFFAVFAFAGSRRQATAICDRLSPEASWLCIRQDSTIATKPANWRYGLSWD
jgi:hypothetical protein